MWTNLELQVQYKREQLRDQLAGIAQMRQANTCVRPHALTRRAARPIGRALFNVGAWLLRYGTDELPATLPVYRPSARSAELN